MKPARTFVFSLVLLAMAHTAGATVIFFTDRTSFQNAVTVTQTVDFESSFPFQNTAITFGDATFVSTDGSGIERQDADGTQGNPTTILAALNFGGIRIDLKPGHFAIGMDLGELFDPASGQFTLTSSSSALLDSRTTTVELFGNNPSFAGWISTVEIGSLEFLNVGQVGNEAIDNVTLGEVGPTVDVPAPATLALLSLGLAGIGFGRRMRAG
jgi:hypothetical protein